MHGEYSHRRSSHPARFAVARGVAETRLETTRTSRSRRFGTVAVGVSAPILGYAAPLVPDGDTLLRSDVLLARFRRLGGRPLTLRLGDG